MNISIIFLSWKVDLCNNLSNLRKRVKDVEHDVWDARDSERDNINPVRFNFIAQFTI